STPGCLGEALVVLQPNLGRGTNEGGHSFLCGGEQDLDISPEDLQTTAFKLLLQGVQDPSATSDAATYQDKGLRLGEGRKVGHGLGHDLGGVVKSLQGDRIAFLGGPGYVLPV